MSQFGSQPADHRSAPESAPAQLSHKRQSSLDSNTTKKSATGGSPSGKKSDPEGKNVLTNVRDDNFASSIELCMMTSMPFSIGAKGTTELVISGCS